MDNEIIKYLFDIQESIDSIQKYLGDRRDFKIYMAPRWCRSATCILL